MANLQNDGFGTILKGESVLDGDGKIPSSELHVGEASGLATLDSSGQVPLSQLGNIPLSPAGAILASVATLAALTAYTNPGAIALLYVQSNKGYYFFDPASTLTSDGFTIVTPSAGSGKWHRQFWGHETWRNQAAWFLDSTSGNDENSGASGFPIKTVKELSFRLGGRSFATALAINIAGTSLTDSLSQLNIEVVPSGSITITGTQTVVQSSTVTHATSVAATTNTAPTLQDTTVADWTPFIGTYMIRSGTKFAWVAADIGSNTARVSQWSTGNFGTATTAPANGAAYDLVTMTAVTGIPTVLGAPESIKLINLAFSSYVYGGNVGGVLYNLMNCYFSSLQLDNGNTVLTGCSTSQVTSTGAGTLVNMRVSLVYGVAGVNTGVASFKTNSSGSFSLCLFQATQASFSNGALGTLSSLGIFDQDGLSVTTGATVLMGNSTSSQGNLYGSGNTTGCLIDQGGTVVCISPAILPTIDGTTQLSFEGSATAIPALVGGTTVPADSSLTTWAQLAASPFSRNVVGYKKRSAFIGT